MDLTLLGAEMRRALHRRLVWVLVALALIGIVVLGVVAYVDSTGKSLAELAENGEHPALLASWWVSSGGGILMIAGLPLLIGGLLGGASVAGAEWRAGTITTVLTWEPRRRRLHLARMLSSFVLASLIALALETLFLSATLPAVLLNGSTAGMDGQAWLSLLAAMARIAALTGVAAVLGGSLATLGRGTTFALGAVFVWMAVIENLLRGYKPSWQPILLGDNLSIVATWNQLETADFTRSTVLATLTVAGYLGIVAVGAAVAFVRGDVGAAS